MEMIIANVEDVVFDIEEHLEKQTAAQPLPFPEMDKSTFPVCAFQARGACQKAMSCSFRHVRGDRTVVCKHWLRGLCKKGDHCEFLHEYDMSKMPECYFYSRFNECHNKECPFLHISAESKMKDCPWYDRGFCRVGPLCRHKHVRRVLCMNYFAGFCPDGPDCKHVHPRFELPRPVDVAPPTRGITCNACGEPGHKSSHCFKTHGRDARRGNDQQQSRGGAPYAYGRGRSVTCFKCGQPGHFANRCSKGDFAFLNPQQQQ